MQGLTGGPGRRPSGHGGSHGEGETERAARATYPRSHLGRRGSEEAARLWQAAASFGVCGGGAVAKGRGRAVAGRLVKLESDPEGLLIGEVRRWGGRSALVSAGELRGAPLMAFGRLRASAARFAAATRRFGQRARGGAGYGARRRAVRARAARRGAVRAVRLGGRCGDTVLDGGRRGEHRRWDSSGRRERRGA